MHTYFTWPELKIGDRFRIAGFDDILVKVSETQAMGLGGTRALHRPKSLAHRNEHIEMSPNVGGLILSI